MEVKVLGRMTHVSRACLVRVSFIPTLVDAFMQHGRLLINDRHTIYISVSLLSSLLLRLTRLPSLALISLRPPSPPMLPSCLSRSFLRCPAR